MSMGCLCSTIITNWELSAAYWWRWLKRCLDIWQTTVSDYICWRTILRRQSLMFRLTFSFYLIVFLFLCALTPSSITKSGGKHSINSLKVSMFIVFFYSLNIDCWPLYKSVSFLFTMWFSHHCWSVVNNGSVMPAYTLKKGIVTFMLVYPYWVICAGGNWVSDPCGSGINKTSVSNHVISVWSGIGMRLLSHVSQEESHMIEGYKYWFFEQTSSFSLLFKIKSGAFWSVSILWDGEINAQVRLEL